MAINFIDAATPQVFETDVATGPATNFVIPVPTSGGPLVAGQFLYAEVVWDTPNTTVPSRTLPSGWVSQTGILQVGSGTAVLMCEFIYHVVTAGEAGTTPSWTVTNTTAFDGSVNVIRLDNVDSASPFCVSSPAAGYSTLIQTTGATTKLVPAVTTTVDGAMLISGVSARTGSGAGGTTSSSGYTVAVNSFTMGGKPGALAYALQPTAGVSSTITWNTTAISGIGIQTALRPATTAAPQASSGALTTTGSGSLTLTGSASQGTAASLSTVGSGSLTLGAKPGLQGAQTLTGSSSLTLSGTSAVAPTPVLRSAYNGFPDPDGIKVAVNGTNATSVRIKAGLDAAVTTGVVYSSAATPNAQGDATVTFTGLPTASTSTRYYYRVAMTNSNGVEVLDSWTNDKWFQLAPTGRVGLSFNTGSCLDATDIMPAIPNRGDPLFVSLGDFFPGYFDGTGTGVANFRSKFDDKLRAPLLSKLFSQGLNIMTPSDHDGMTNDSTAGSDPTAWANWNQVVREKLATPTLPANGIYWSRPWGTAIRFIVLDTRSFKVTGTTVLGATQKQWFKDTLSAATEDLVIIVQDTPWVGTSTAGETGWLGTIAERNELGDFIAASGKKVVMLAGDMHALAYDNGASANNRGGVKVYQAAPLNKSNSTKGGPYTLGPVTASTTQYGRVVVTPGAGTITSQFTGYDAANTAVLSPSADVFTLTSASGSLTTTGSGSLTLSGQPKPTGSLAPSGSGSLALSGQPKPTGSLALSGSSSLTVQRLAPGQLSPVGTGLLTLSGKPGYLGSVALSSAPGSLVLAGATNRTIGRRARAAIFLGEGSGFVRIFNAGDPVPDSVVEANPEIAELVDIVTY